MFKNIDVRCYFDFVRFGSGSSYFESTGSTDSPGIWKIK